MLLPPNFLYNFLKPLDQRIGSSDDDDPNYSMIMFDIRSYNKMKMMDSYTNFIETIRQVYPKYKLSYLEQPLTYQRFTTLLRQLARNTPGATFEIKTHYHYSKFQRDYCFYFNS